MGHSDLEVFKQTEDGKWPEFRRKRDLYEPLPTAMALVLPSFNATGERPQIATSRIF